MIYEVRTTMFFDEQDEAVDFFNDGEMALPKATVVNPGTANQECSVIDLLECYHDEDPHKPCVPIFHYDNCPLNPP